MLHSESLNSNTIPFIQNMDSTKRGQLLGEQPLPVSSKPYYVRI